MIVEGPNWSLENPSVKRIRTQRRFFLGDKVAISDEDLAHVILVFDDGAQVIQTNETGRLWLRRRIYHLSYRVLHKNYSSVL